MTNCVLNIGHSCRRFLSGSDTHLQLISIVCVLCSCSRQLQRPGLQAPVAIKDTRVLKTAWPQGSPDFRYISARLAPARRDLVTEQEVFYPRAAAAAQRSLGKTEQLPPTEVRPTAIAAPTSVGDSTGTWASIVLVRRCRLAACNWNFAFLEVTSSHKTYFLQLSTDVCTCCTGAESAAVGAQLQGGADG